MMQPWFEPTRFESLYRILVVAIVPTVVPALGVLSAILAPKGKGKKLLLAGYEFMLMLGVANLAAGIAALAYHQPQQISGSLLVVGIVLTVIFAAFVPFLRQQYQQFELRHMEAEALRRS